MTTIDVKQKSVLASGMANLIVQGDNNAETICFHFANPDAILTASLTYELIYVRSDLHGTSVSLTRTEGTDGSFNLLWTPDAAATICSGKFAFNIIAMDADGDLVWKSATAGTWVNPSVNPAYPVDPSEEGKSYQDLFMELGRMIQKAVYKIKVNGEEFSTRTGTIDLGTLLREHQSLEDYSLIAETGYKLDLEIDPNTYVVTPKLYNKEGDLISTGKSIDLPMESAIVSITYDAKTNSLILTLRDGKTTTVPLSGLIEGLATEKWVEDKGYLTDQSLSEYRKSADQDKIDADKVSKVEGSSLVPDTKIASYDEHIVDSDIHVTTDDKTAWNAKYDKPSTGIPKADLTESVQTSLGKADTALQEHQSLAAYSLTTDTGYKLDLEIDPDTFVITPKMYDINETLISTGKSIDLPLESVVVSGSYDVENKKIVLTLKNGSTVDIPVGDLISGPATQPWVEEKGYYTKPSTGIPKTDLAEGIQTSLGLADTALQEHQSLSAYRTSSAQDTIDNGKVSKAGDTMTGGLVVPSITLNGTSLAESKARIDQTWQPDENNPAGYIGMRIEGGGIIFFDYKYGYKYGSLSVAPETNLKSYHVDKATNVVVCDNPGDTSKNDRFYVVQEFDIGVREHGDCLEWGDSGCPHLYNVLVGTSTAFGQGYHNTELCTAAADLDKALSSMYGGRWSTTAVDQLWNYLWEGDWQYRSPKWFLPSKDELNVLLNMQWQDSARWRGYNNEILKRIPVNFYSHYWSSSESSSTFAHFASFYSGNMDTVGKTYTNYNYVRLCRTF